MAASNVVTASWASPAPVENPRRGPNTGLPAGVVHLRKPIVPNSAPSASAAAIAYIAAALSPAAFQRATQAALRDARDRGATEEEQINAQAAFRIIMGDWGFSRPD
tara:strand:+ start:304 stop:621 length:318 start_codon:yes stop_codon:yes gene_type:complete